MEEVAEVLSLLELQGRMLRHTPFASVLALVALVRHSKMVAGWREVKELVWLAERPLGSGVYLKMMVHDCHNWSSMPDCQRIVPASGSAIDDVL